MIIVGGLIVFSILWCIIRCACCGLSCCCECCYCLKCCGSCCGMCDSPKKKKYLDDPYVPPHHDQGYRAEPTMTAARAVPASTFDHSYDKPITKPDPPMYAEFETGKKGGGDELPAMPEWEASSSKKVAMDDAVELEQLKKPEIAQNAPLMAPGAMSPAPSPNPSSPMHGNSPYGAPAMNGSGYMTPARSATYPYGADPNAQQQGYNQGNYGNGGYGQMQRSNTAQTYDQSYGNQGYGNQGYNNNQGYGNQGYDNQEYGAQAHDNQGYGAQGTYDTQGYGNQGYGAGAAAAAAAAAAGPMAQGRRTPAQEYGNYRRGTADQAYPQSRTPRPYEDSSYGRSVTPRIGTPRSNTPGNGYRQPPRHQSPAPQNMPYGHIERTQSPALQQDAYGMDRSNTPNSYGRRNPPAPVRQYSAAASQPMRHPEPERSYTEPSYGQSTSAYQPEPASPTSPITNSGGFDFTSGYSRPQNSGTSTPVQQPAAGGSAYPGYRAYKPQQ